MKVEGDRKRKSQLGKESEKEKKVGGRKKGNESECGCLLVRERVRTMRE